MSELEEGKKYCKHCGEVIDKDCVVCPKCGKQVEALKAFMEACGEEPDNVEIPHKKGFKNIFKK